MGMGMEAEIVGCKAWGRSYWRMERERVEFEHAMEANAQLQLFFPRGKQIINNIAAATTSSWSLQGVVEVRFVMASGIFTKI